MSSTPPFTAAGALSGLHVAVIGINYAPEVTGIAPYTTAFCDHLRAAGAELEVVTGLPHYPHWTIPPRYARRLHVEEQVGPLVVRRLRHALPGGGGGVGRAIYELSFGAHVLARGPQRSSDVILVVVPSLAGAAAGLARVGRRTPAVVWVQDLMGPAVAQSGISGSRRLHEATRALEGAVLRRAQAVVVVSEAFARYVEDQGVPAERIVQVCNWSHVPAPSSNRAQVRARMGWGADEIIALHAGSMGHKQGLETVICAARLAATGRSRVRFVLMGDGSQRRALEAEAAGSPSVVFVDPVPEPDFPDVLAAADVLVVNQRPTVREMSLPSKLTSYFCAGRPVVASVPTDGATAAEIRRSGGGVVVAPADPHALLEGVLSVADGDDPEVRPAAGQRYAREHLGAERAMVRLAGVLAGAAHGRS